MTHSRNPDILADLAFYDDMKKKWPREDLLNTLELRKSEIRIICDYLLKESDNLTLEDLFEVVISSEKDPRPGYLISKILDCRSFGRKKFLALVERMGKINFGVKCNLIWRRKQQMLLDSCRVKGMEVYNWSFQINNEGRETARFRTGQEYMPRYKNTANKSAH